MVRVNLYEKKVIEPLTVSMNREWSYDVSYGTTHGSLNLYEIGPLTVPLGLLSILNKSFIFSSKYIKKISILWIVERCIFKMKQNFFIPSLEMVEQNTSKVEICRDGITHDYLPYLYA